MKKAGEFAEAGQGRGAAQGWNQAPRRQWARARKMRNARRLRPLPDPSVPDPQLRLQASHPRETAVSCMWLVQAARHEFQCQREKLVELQCSECSARWGYNPRVTAQTWAKPITEE